MNRDEADRAIAAAGAAHDQVAAAMYGIDSHPGLNFLRAGGVTGRTRDIWDALSPEIDARWSEFSAMGEQLEQARTIRVQYRPSDPNWATLQRLVTVDVPTLARTLQASCAAIAGILGDVNVCWSIVSAAVVPVTDSMAALRQRGTEVGSTDGLQALQLRVDELAARLLDDPLAAAPRGTLRDTVRTELDQMAADLSTASKQLTALISLRDGYPQRVAELTGRIERLRSTEENVRHAYARAAEKIARPGLPEVPRSHEVLRARLAELDARRSRQDWRKLADDVAVLEASIARAQERAESLAAAADGLVERRNELRGRLEAYRAKAASHRLDEHDGLAPLHTAARDLLHTAPCDLQEATKAVYAYQRMLTDLVRPQEGSIR
jgi:hypothetical protein